jgi:hypothetical protein
MRIYIEGVLRFGIPPTFVMGIVKPDSRIKNSDDKIKGKLMTVFAEAHLEGMYGQKEDAQDEDFFPYLMSSITCPVGMPV